MTIALAVRMESSLENVLAFRPAAADEGGLRELLNAHIACGQARARRMRLVPFFALSSFSVWVAAVWPALLSAYVRGGVLMTWLVLFAGLGGTGLRERRLERKLRRLLTRMEPGELSSDR